MDDRLELFFSQSLDGFFFMMLDAPVRWDDATDKDAALDYVFAHQRVTKVNDAMLAQYGVSRERVRQIEVRAFEKLQKSMRAAALEKRLIEA